MKKAGTKNYDIRVLTRAEFELAIDWAAREGWNPGLGDADCFHAADPEGFLLGELDGEPVASISVVRYGDGFAFLGFYIVRPEYRGRGFGYTLWQSAMARMDDRVVGLDGVVDQQENYRRSGFELAHRNIRYEGRTGGARPDHPGLRPLADISFERLLAFDQEHFCVDRATFLDRWIRQPGCASLALEDNGSLKGYGVIRPCRNGYKIGPLFSRDGEVAEVLFRSLVSRAPEGTPVFLDVPETNRDAVALAERHDMSLQFETARMYRGATPALPLANIFGITSFELG